VVVFGFFMQNLLIGQITIAVQDTIEQIYRQEAARRKRVSLNTLYVLKEMQSVKKREINTANNEQLSKLSQLRTMLQDFNSSKDEAASLSIREGENQFKICKKGIV